MMDVETLSALVFILLANMGKSSGGGFAAITATLDKSTLTLKGDISAELNDGTLVIGS